jgi:hypothetical protein
MSGSPRADWHDLTAELDLWGEAGRAATLWWRDDDAIAPTPQLARLLRLAAGVPLALAVIPALVRPELTEALAGRPHVAVLQHGWQHVNRAGIGAKRSEYPPGRARDAVVAEIVAGRARLRALFGPRAAAVFVPPWNRIANEFVTILPECGIAGLSGMASPHRSALPPDLAQRDAHLDLVAWTENRRFIGEPVALAALVRRLQGQRLGGIVRPPPVGLLTHHLIMDGATAAFIERLIAFSRSHRALRWAVAADLL